MRSYDIIVKKRNGESLTKQEIDYFISGYTKGHIPDYQVSALMMAIYFQGMNQQETSDLTQAMIHSGEVIDLSKISGFIVDKHSTGGVGDKTSLVLGPLVAAAGVKVAKLSGRGLGHTGGTIDKLESISGFTTQMTKEEFIKNVNEYGIAIGCQTSKLVPADKSLYSLRDVTGTIENVALIASSIMSKKLASGADGIVLDVKAGDGAFMHSADDAFELGKEMVAIGTGMGKETIAVVTDMEQPLGNAIGNSLEVIEAIDTLKGEGPKDLHDLCLELGSHMLLLASLTSEKEKALKILEDCIQSGKAYEKFKTFVHAQHGNTEEVGDTSKLPQAEYQLDIIYDKEGYINDLHAKTVGEVSLYLGAGRETKESKIDLAAGVYLHKKEGDHINSGDKLATLYTNTADKTIAANDKLMTAYKISSTQKEKLPLIFGVVNKDGITVYQ